MSWVGIILLAYLIGSIPAAYLAGRMVKGKDIWDEGDGNPGAGNVFRAIGPKAGLLVGAVDIGKGVVVVVLARVILGGNGIEMAAGAAAVAGPRYSGDAEHGRNHFLQTGVASRHGVPATTETPDDEHGLGTDGRQRRIL